MQPAGLAAVEKGWVGGGGGSEGKTTAEEEEDKCGEGEKKRDGRKKIKIITDNKRHEIHFL